MALPKAIFIVGPTASGKTALGVALAKRFDGEIISADSRQIYRGMDIGTGKEKERQKTIDGENAAFVQGIPQYCVDSVDPDASYTLADFQDNAFRIMRKIWARGKTPFIVGGTGLYVQAVVDNLEIPRVPPNPELRAKMEGVIHEHGIEKVYLELLKIDPDAADFVGPHNARRIIRALEVSLATGKPFSKQKKRGKRFFRSLQIGIECARDDLYEKINARIDAMMEKGFEKEVRSLAKKYPLTLPPFTGIGYEDIGRAIRKEISLAEAVEKIKQRSRDYARRQLTWFRKDARIRWVKGIGEAEKFVRAFLRKE